MDTDLEALKRTLYAIASRSASDLPQDEARAFGVMLRV